MTSAIPQKKTDWKTLVLLAGMWTLFLGNFYLYAVHPLPLFFHILISVLAIHCAFTIWHEALHGNIFEDTRLNNLAGVLGMIPYMTPFFIQKHIHLMHHSRLNEDDDPNRIYADGPFWQIFFRYFRAIPYMKRLLKKDPRSPKERLADYVSVAVILSIYAAAWQQGKLLDLMLIWAVPVAIAKVIMDWYINYLPHAGLPAHKFKGTRIIDAPWFTPFVFAHNYHAIHHLWPQFSWHRYPSLYKERKEKLIQYGVPIESSPWNFRSETASVG